MSGVVYAYRPVADYGSFADGLGHIYYLGRSKRREFSAPDLMGNETLQKEVLSRYGQARGLNRASRILMWIHVPDMQAVWDRLIDHARGNVWCTRTDPASERPTLTHHCALGDNWYSCNNTGPTGIGEWFCEVIVEEVRKIADQARLNEATQIAEQARQAREADVAGT